MNQDRIADRDIDLLEYIYHSPSKVKQRSLADVIGVSLGMTNVIMKRLARKGWLMIRKVNNRNIQYAVSPAGVEVIARRSYRYLKRTIKNVVRYKEELEKFVLSVKRKGYKGIVLIGASDVDFILDHLCGRNQIDFTINALNKKDQFSMSHFYLYSENFDLQSLDFVNNNKKNVDHVANIFMKLEG